MEEKIIVKKKREIPFFQVENELLDVGILDPYQFIIFIFLLRYANNSEGAFPSLRTLEKKCKMSRPTIVKKIKELEDLGLLEKEERYMEFKGKKVRTSNIYYLNSIQDITTCTEEDTASLMKEDTSPGKGDLPPLVKEVNHPLVKEVNHPGKGG